MVLLFNDYTATYHVQSASRTVQSTQSEPVHSQTSVRKPQARMKSRLKKQRMETGGSSKETELQIYLSEKLVEDEENVDFDVLRWWKVNSDRFPILSRMARDVLVVLISTVASESAFSTSELSTGAAGSSLSTVGTLSTIAEDEEWMNADC
ncbi:PREDICTED: zinc finger BED domain-containing protein DAYSLEEPER-like [Ipomoea nil]|uniref:zinc finger BED domain-containing protein DAYSLEEPER-like n=1 Tax=Ipomoea nil TaxID=35883 RepID=UPI0009016422|nr:PREDICTED: zinc finger BED domain-containing protein DAYSLEEPER-like [Ipomoea nil]